ncbi:hypothetical protein SSX86_009378 [Deinandra increscens subsp. villosa]|uniref:Uncharacterized protein n=1 Tax=Deinandra increscens subsp. villosa TaxID=3103831 RepID=A0AAP0H5Y5_9ASTR
MEGKAVCFCTLVAVLGLISAVTGFAAEVTRVKDVSIEDYSCVYPSSPALALGIISAIFAFITQVFISITLGVCNFCKKDPNSTPISKLLSILSRLATVIAVVLLLTGARLSNNKGGQVESYNYIKCYVVKPGIFAIGATLALLSAVFGIAAYITVAPPSPQAATNPAIASPAGANIDLENNPVPIRPQQYTPK